MLRIEVGSPWACGGQFDPDRNRSIEMVLHVLRWSLLLLAAMLAACSNTRYDLLQAQRNVAPTNYKGDILAFLRTYLNDPTNIREAAVTQPSVLRVGAEPRQVVCVRFNAKNSRGQYAGVINTAAIFSSGKLDRFIDLTPDETAPDAALRAQLRQPCQSAAYEPFPELQRLAPRTG